MTSAWPRRAILFAVAALTVVLAWRTEASRDLGFHIAAGNWILEHYAWPRVDSFTYTLAGRPYIDMNGLFQIALALAYRGGMIGLGLLRLAFALATFGILWLSARRRGVESPALLGLGFAIAILTWEVRLMTRPELAGGLSLAAQLYLLRRHADTNDRRFLFATVPLQLVWVYSHSLSLFGIAVLGLYALARTLANPRDLAPWLALAGAAAVMFLNPYGWSGAQWQLSLGSRIAQGNPFADTQLELVSPFSADADRFPALIFFRIMLAVTALALLAGARRVSLFEGSVIALFGTLAAVHMRIVAMFAIAALPVVLEAASGTIGRVFERRTVTVAALLAIAFVCEQTVSGGLYTSNRYPFRFGSGESPAVFPVGTVKTLDRLGGPIFNTIEHGGYLELRRPNEKVFIDGRLEIMDEDFFLPYLGALEGGDGWKALETRWHPAVALVPANDRDLVRTLLDEPGWALVDVDAVAFLFARATPDHLEAIEANQQRLRRLNAPAETTEEAIVPAPRPSWLAALFGPKNRPFEAFGRGANFLQIGMFDAARRELRQALLATSQPEPALIKSYVIAAAQLGRLDEARAWCGRLVELAPQDGDALALLARLKSDGS